MEILNNINNILTNFIMNYKVLGLIICCFLIFLEALIPILPLSLFITIVFLIYGKIIGFLVAWLFSILGTLTLFTLISNFNLKLKKMRKYLDKFSDINFFNLIVLYAIPFNPTSLITLICSFSKINIKKFILALIIGKAFCIYFWGFIGCSFLESLTNFNCLVKVIIGFVIMYLLTYIIKRKYKFLR